MLHFLRVPYNDYKDINSPTLRYDYDQQTRPKRFSITFLTRTVEMECSSSLRIPSLLLIKSGCLKENSEYSHQA